MKISPNTRIRSKVRMANPPAEQDVNYDRLMRSKEWEKAKNDVYRHHDDYSKVRKQFLNESATGKHTPGSQVVPSDYFKGDHKRVVQCGELIADDLSVDGEAFAHAFTDNKTFESDSILFVDDNAENSDEKSDNSRQLMLECLSKINEGLYEQLLMKTRFITKRTQLHNMPDKKTTSLDKDVIKELTVMPWSKLVSKTNCRCHRVVDFDGKLYDMRNGRELEDECARKTHMLWCDSCFNVDGENSTCQIVGKIRWCYIMRPKAGVAMRRRVKQLLGNRMHYNGDLYDVKVGLELLEFIPHDCSCAAPSLNKEAWSFSQFKEGGGSDGSGYCKIQNFPCDLLMGDEGRKAASLCDQWRAKDDKFLPAMGILDGKPNSPGDDERFFLKFPCPAGVGAFWNREACWKLLMRAFAMCSVMSDCVDEWTSLQRQHSSISLDLDEKPHMHVLFVQLLMHGVPKREINSNGVMQTILEAITNNRQIHQVVHCDFNYSNVNGQKVLVHNNPRLKAKNVWPGTLLFALQAHRKHILKGGRGDDNIMETARGEALAMNGGVYHAGYTSIGEEATSPLLAGHIMMGSTLHACDTERLVLDLDASRSSTFMHASRMDSSTLQQCFNDKIAKDLETFIEFHVKKDGSTDPTLLSGMREKLGKAATILDEEQERVDRRLDEEAYKEAAKQARMDERRKEGVLHHIAESKKKAAPANASRNERAQKRHQNKNENYLTL